MELPGHVVVDAAEGGVLALLLPEVREQVVQHEVLQPDRRAAALGRDLVEEIEIPVTAGLR